MKKIGITFLSLLATFSMTAVSAANSPLTIINNSKLHITVNYSLCDVKKNMCTLIKENSIDTLQSGMNHLAIITSLDPKLNSLTIVAAIAKDDNGRQVASLDKSCDMPANSNTVVLDNHDTSRIDCQFN